MIRINLLGGKLSPAHSGPPQPNPLPRGEVRSVLEQGAFLICIAVLSFLGAVAAIGWCLNSVYVGNGASWPAIIIAAALLFLMYRVVVIADRRWWESKRAKVLAGAVEDESPEPTLLKPEDRIFDEVLADDELPRRWRKKKYPRYKVWCRAKRIRKIRRKQSLKTWFAKQKQRFVNLWGWVKGSWKKKRKKSKKKETPSPFLAWFMHLGFTLRVSNNARATLFLLVSAFWFCINVVTLIASFVFAPNRLTDTQEQSYNYMLHGVRATDLEMSSTLTQVLTWCWSIVSSLFVNPWSWILWFSFALFSFVYFVVAQREEFAEVIDSARETVSQRATTDLPDQPSGQPSAHPPAGAGGGALGNFLKNRARFAVEDLSWDLITRGFQRGIGALRRGAI
ncbi:MAG: hypothetical protein AAB367_01365 [Patescibacteria group bacterium]